MNVGAGAKLSPVIGPVTAALLLFCGMATVLAVMTEYNPVQQTLGLNERLSRVVLFFALMFIFGCCAALLRYFVAAHREICLLLCTLGACAMIVAAAAKISNVPPDEYLLLNVGRYAWWLAIGCGLCVLPAVKGAAETEPPTSWWSWAAVAATAFTVGITLHVLRRGPAPHSLLVVKSTLILLIPTVCSIAVALKSPVAVRILATICAILGVAEGAIH
jgi:hypothetical protein